MYVRTCVYVHISCFPIYHFFSAGGDQYWNARYPRAVFQYLVTHVTNMLLLLLPYLAVLALFLAFVFLNGSIALGDKAHHVVTFHVPQVFYFLVFTLALSPSCVLDVGTVRGFFASSVSNWRRVVCVFAVLVVAMGVAVHLFTLVECVCTIYTAEF